MRIQISNQEIIDPELLLEPVVHQIFSHTIQHQFELGHFQSMHRFILWGYLGIPDGNFCKAWSMEEF